MKITLRLLAGVLAVLLTAAAHAAGSLRITLFPSAAISAGAQWRVDGGAWQASGATVKGLSAGTHSVDYKTTSGWITPAPVSVAITNGNTTSVTATYVQAASVRVNLTPATAQWRLNGGAWRASGDTATDLPAGTYAIDYSAVAGYASPAAETVTVSSGQALILDRSYVQLAQIAITLTPAQAKWRVDGGAWQLSGATVADLAPGSHAIDYEALAGHIAPASESVTLSAGQTLALSRAYVQYAEVSLVLSPASAQWRIGGGSWLASGATAGSLAPGTYTIDYAPVPGYVTPPSETVTLASGVNPTLNRSYAPQPASLTVTLSPATAQWRVDGGPWLASGATLSTLVPGAHTIEFESIPGYATPSAQTVTLANGEQRTLSVTYTAVGSISVSINPNWVSGQWRVDGGEWRESGTSANNLSVGVAHTVEFSSVPGYVTPAAQTVTLSTGEFRFVSGTYVQLASVSVNANPNWITGAQWRIDNGPWREMGSSANSLSFDTPHTIDFSPVAGYVTPASQTVTLASGEYRFVTGTYVQLGSVSVYVNPSWLTAQWRIDNGPWRDAGTSAYSLALDTPHTVEFSDVPYYTTPAPQTFTLSAGEFRMVTGTYTELAYLYVSLDLSEAKWRIDGGRWNNANTSVYGIGLGTHTIEYSQHDGYLTPATETVTLNSGYATISRSYASDPAFLFDYNLAGLAVNLDPTFAEWRIDGGRWNTSGAMRFNLTPGTHTIEYSSVADWISPASETVTLIGGTAQTLYTPYVSIDPGQLTIVTNPSSGQWRVYRSGWPASGTWRASGETATGLNPGSYTIEYSPVTGYDVPYVNSTQLLPNESKTVSVDYQPRMFQYTIVLNPSTARFRLNGGAWNPSGATTMGHQPGNYLIEFEPVAGYVTPAPVTVTFQAGAVETLTFTYTPQ